MIESRALYFATMRSKHSGNVAKKTSRSDLEDSYLVRDREQKENHDICMKDHVCNMAFFVSCKEDWSKSIHF